MSGFVWTDLFNPVSQIPQVNSNITFSGRLRFLIFESKTFKRRLIQRERMFRFSFVRVKTIPFVFLSRCEGTIFADIQ